MRDFSRVCKNIVIAFLAVLTLPLLSACGAEKQGENLYNQDLPVLNRTNHPVNDSDEVMPDLKEIEKKEKVEEGGLLQWDDRYLYTVKGNQLLIAQIMPVDEMKILQVVEIEDGFYPVDLFVEGRHLALIGTVEKDRAVYEDSVEQDRAFFTPASVKALVYEIDDYFQLQLKRKVLLEGRYLSSRRVGAVLYLIANRSRSYHPSEGDQKEVWSAFFDTASAENPAVIDVPEIHYFPYYVEPEYLLVASFNMLQHEQKAQIAAYLGAGEYVYASPKNLYVAVTQYNPKNPLIVAPEQERVNPLGSLTLDEHTSIYKFAIQDGKLVFKGQGTVPGTLLHRYSMDEQEGKLRIVTTKGNPWVEGEGGARQQLYLLDETLSIAGKLEEIAPGEQLTTLCFLDKEIFLVTFQEESTLHRIAIETDSKVLNLTKIMHFPGYYNLLYPYGDRSLLGLGKDKGILLSFFDLSDPDQPVSNEKFVERVGHYGSDTPLFRDQHSLFIGKDSKIIAFPVKITEEDKEKEAFFGFYVYRFDEEKGFHLMGKIEEAQKDWEEGWTGRIFTIEKNFYTVSPSKVQVFGLEQLEYRGELRFP
ncbi:beta-propeller domain-containing protein [Heliorestis convoluta]|uniref:Lipoprotein n=1 Tax=Heliorestis convoluta TaxID=356322 RepID=A0A5Q2N4P7_9FIRM|nr:beta-propeller domain-containing protein [Heliorestis convoluta]QGG47545.1 hypothetical protein FTV88_1398 [Heliorestis convoluta]